MPAKAKTEETLLGAKQVATQLKVDAKVLRRFLRATDVVPNAGRGARYEIKRAQIPAIRKAFTEWTKANEAKTEK